MLVLHDWQSFYTVIGTAAATLIGLLFAELFYLTLGLRNTWTLMIWLIAHSGGQFTVSERERRKKKFSK